VPGNDPLHKVTIIPRGRALGVTMNLPETDRYSLKFREITAKLAMMFGGRIAEEIIYGVENVSTGASNDIQQATNLARRMVTEWGMSEKLGRLRYVDNQEEVFLGHSVTRSQTISDETAKLIDEEVRRIVEEAETKARTILTEHIDELHKVAKALLEFESLSGEEVKDLLAGNPIRQGGDSSGPHKPRSSIPTSGAAPKPTPGGFEPKPAGS
jgi:cell division protease FtsH